MIHNEKKKISDAYTDFQLASRIVLSVTPSSATTHSSTTFFSPNSADSASRVFDGEAAVGSSSRPSPADALQRQIRERC